ncbi:MAG: thioredoxin domain-containing protein, partial [Alphaproteobacteria bacterium]|nr:thioredoxin domain-containing protein [Alphaproteobacteria bacterium]
KVLADWNGLMIAALANAGAVFRNTAWTHAAVRAFDFIERALGDGDRLYHSWREGRRQHTGFADDYAQMARAAFTLWETTSDKRYFERARAWVHTLNDHFWDGQNGGYFYTPDDSDPLIFRSRTVFDQATPAANGVMVSLLARMHLATWDRSYRERCNALVEAFSGEPARAYTSMASYLIGLDVVMTGLQIVVVGSLTSPKTHELVGAVMGRSLPNRTLVLADPGDALIEGHPAYGKKMENGHPTAYICQRETCSAPITNPVALSQALQLPLRAAGRA